MTNPLRALLSFAPFFVIAIFSGCIGDNPASPSPEEKAALLTGSKWRLASHTIVPAIDWDANGTLITDLLEEHGDCLRDDVASYASDHSYTIEEGGQKCDPADPEVEKGTWSLEPAEDGLTLHSELDPDPIAFSIARISATQLVLRRTQVWPEDGNSHTETLTFVAK
jgi:hypothetical protein